MADRKSGSWKGVGTVHACRSTHPVQTVATVRKGVRQEVVSGQERGSIDDQLIEPLIDCHALP